MKRIIGNVLIMLLLLVSSATWAQERDFCGKVYNSEYGVWLDINLYEETVDIPGQDVLGKVFGYLKKATDSRVWIIMSVKFSDNDKKATLEMVNDYGSEELVATLTLGLDGSYTLKQEEGSAIKVADKGKWLKLPKVMVFRKQTKQ